MMTVRRIQSANRLNALFDLPGGRTVRRMLADAESQLAAFRPSFDEELETRIAAIEGLSAAGALGRAEIYDNASAIIDTAGLFGCDHVGEAAYALCDLVDALGEQNRWDASAVAVHVDALRLMRDADCNVLERERLLAGLHAVFEKVTAS